MVYLCYFLIIHFYFSFDRVPNEIEDSQRVGEDMINRKIFWWDKG